MSEKATGYTLLLLGVVLIALALVSVYLVFTGRTKPYPLFSLSGISLDLSNLVTDEAPENLPQNNLKTELLEAEAINQPLNLLTYLLLMGFVANIGFKIASLGVFFLRPIKVNLRAESKSVLEP